MSTVRVKVTIDARRAERILRDASKRFGKPQRRKIARPAAKLLETDMRSGSGGIVPKYTKGKQHIFTRPKTGYRLIIKAGNLRKSHKLMTFRRSGLMWVGARYRKGAGYAPGTVIGATYRTADGFYDNMYIAKTGNNYPVRAMSRKESEIKLSLVAEAQKYLKKVVGYAAAQ